MLANKLPLIGSVYLNPIQSIGINLALVTSFSADSIHLNISLDLPNLIFTQLQQTQKKLLDRDRYLIILLVDSKGF
jgi:hypothetical protein